MKCPYEPILCDCIESVDTDPVNGCGECKHYPDPVKKLMEAYPVEQMLGFLPKSIIKDRKVVFRYHDIFDLNISKDSLDNWVIDYINDKNLKSLFHQSNKDIHRCLALMLADLIGNDYIQKLDPGAVMWKVNTPNGPFDRPLELKPCLHEKNK